MKLVSGLATKVKASNLTKFFSGHRDQIGVRSVLWQWRLEFTVVLISCALLGGIFGVLHHNRGQEVAGWSLSGMSLNTLIALLSALLRAHILTIVEEATSTSSIKPAEGSGVQSYFQLGSVHGCAEVKLIRSFSSYIYVGCFIMVLSLGIGPFTQQASSTQPCIKTVTGASATIPYSWTGLHVFKGGKSYVSPWMVDTGYSEAIVRASTNSSSVSSASLLQGCTTGNCSFPAVRGDIALSTQGICSRCIDTTSYVRSGNSTGVILPKEAGSLYVGTVGWTSNTIESKVSDDLEWARADFDDDLRDTFEVSILNYTFLGLTSDGCQFENRTTAIKNCIRPPAIKEYSIRGFNVYSAACTFYFCTRHHKVDVRSGVLTETLITDTPGFFQPVGTPRFGRNHVWKPVCDVDSQTLDLTSARTISVGNESVQVELRGPGTEKVDIPWTANCTAYVGNMAKAAIRTALFLIEGDCRYSFKVENLDTLSERVDFLRCDPWNIYGLLSGGLASFSTTSETMSRIATSISDRMREKSAKNNFRADALSGPEADQQGGYIKGDVQYTTICTRFQWRWLLGPALLLLMAIGFFIHAVTRSVIRRGHEPLWKSSILPALYFNPNPQGQGSKHKLSELEKGAKGKFVALSITSEGKWELVDDLDEVSGSGQSDQSNEDEVALMDLPPPRAQEGDDASR
ncbi:unnamed protein product [Clonostachys byssicola]|uniref:Uncharacterized protein n=1 Tax=Clonostachys byssicola TaxID=160290 RepID=A0A9N9U1C2_9HYPO|nr:unnamed protein product [Clonostachys byssicola]